MKPVKLVVTVLLAFYAVAALVGGLRVLTATWPRAHSLLVAEIAPALLALVLILAVARGSGLSRPVIRPLVASVVAGLPAALGLVVILLLPGTDRTPAEAWPLLAVRVLLAQVLLEELLFRGVALQRLDALCSPRAAAVLAAVAFGLCHIGNLFFRPLTTERLVEVGIQVVYTTVLAFAPIILVRRSGGVLWGAFAWHLLLDLSILFPNASDRPAAVVVGLAGALATVPVAWAAGRWVMRESRPSVDRAGAPPRGSPSRLRSSVLGVHRKCYNVVGVAHALPGTTCPPRSSIQEKGDAPGPISWELCLMVFARGGS